MIVVNLKKADIKFTKHQNGNEYASIVVEKRKEADKYGNDYTVYNSQTIEQRAEKGKRQYCGNGKEYTWKAEGKKEFNKQEMEDLDILPF